MDLNPNVHETWNNRGTVRNDLKQYELAISDFNKAIELSQNYAEGYANKAKSLTILKRHEEAFVAYERALSIKPDLAEAWLGRGNVFADLKRYDDAFAAYEKALSIKPDLAEAGLARGNVFLDLRRHDEALAAYEKALLIKPDLAEAWLGRGDLYSDLTRYDEAFVAYDKAFSMNPDLPGLEGARLHTKMHLCNWNNYEEDVSCLRNGIAQRKQNCTPFPLLALTDSAEEHLRCALTWISAAQPASTTRSIWQGKIYAHNKTRVGYLSGDFRDHPVSRLLAGVFETHDTERFETHAFSIGPNDHGDLRSRLERSFHQFHDLDGKNDDAITNAIRSTEVDILVDLVGYTRGNRAGVLALRPAPVTVNYLGYPGTMAASYVHYIIGDNTVFTATDASFYSEKLVRLPHSYQPTDRKRQISERVFGRQELGLPQGCMVFCCFNNNYKITPDVFDSWMHILRCVEGSVLWLFRATDTAIDNLRKQAASHGVDSGRIVFADRMEQSEHLARLSVADLFLDTTPYNAHATASDALWSGLPLLTLGGKTFAARVAGSVLTAIGLPELIADSRKEYEALAIELGRDRGKLQAIRNKLEENRLTTVLFDTLLYTKHLEAAYDAMYRKHQAGLPPDHIEVQPMTLVRGGGEN